MSNQLRNVQDKLASQEEEICNLEKKLSEYNDTKAANESLTKWFTELQRWVEEFDSKIQERDAENTNLIECGAKKLKKAEMHEIQLRAENQKLNDLNKCLSEQLKTIKRKEETLLVEIEEFETSNNILENELYEAQNELQEKGCLVVKLTKDLKKKQEELLCFRMQQEECKATAAHSEDQSKSLEADVLAVSMKLEECQRESCRLREQTRDLEADVECARSKLKDVKIRAATTEARLKSEAEALVKDLECRARKLHELEAECGEVQSHLCEEQSEVDKLEALVAELQATNEQERCEVEAREQRLRQNACERDKEVRKLGEQLAATRRDNEDTETRLTELKTRARANDSVLDNARWSAEARDRAHDEAREQLERKKATLSYEVQHKTTAMIELERQVCKLRDELRRVSSSNNNNNNRYCGGSKPSSRISSAVTPIRARPATVDGCSGATADDSFINGLKRLYNNLEQFNENKTRRI